MPIIFQSMKRMPPVSVFFFLTLCKDCCKTLDGRYKLHSYIADVASFHSRGWWLLSILTSWYPQKIGMTFKREVRTNLIWYQLFAFITNDKGKELSWNTLWCQLEEPVLLIRTVLLFSPIFSPKFKVWLLFGSIP